MTILLTGATGFIGSHLLKRLLDKKHQVVALKRSGRDVSGLSHPLLRWHDVDDHLADLFRSETFDAVVHMAAIYGRKGEDIRALIEGNMVFPLRLLQLACEAGCERFLHTDTFYSKSPQTYDHLQEYILSKQQLAAWCRIFARNHPAISFYNVRLEHVYGPGDRADKFIPYLIDKLSSGASNAQLTTGEQRRDFIFVEDVVEAYMTLLEMNHPAHGFEEVGVGTGTTHTVREMAEVLKTVTGSSCHLDFGALPQRRGEIMESCADNRFLLKHGWKSRMDFIPGLTATVKATQRKDPS